MLLKLLDALKGELGLALVRTFIARGIAAFGGVVLFIVLGRLYGAEGVGVFALAQSIYLGAGILARYGMDNALIRYIGQNPSSSSVAVYLRWALTKSALLSTAAAIVIYLLRDQLALCFNAPMLGIVLPGIALAIPPFTVAFVLAGFMKGIRKPATACLLENGGIALVATALVLLFNNLSSKGISASGWAMAAAAWIVLGQGLWQAWKWRRSTPLETNDQTLDLTAFKSSSNAFFVMSLAPFMQQTVFILIAGWYLSDTELGLFKVAERAALLISFVLFVINSVFPPHFAKLYAQGKVQQLERFARYNSGFALTMGTPVIMLLLYKHQSILQLFEGDWSEAALLLKILLVAHGIRLLFSSCEPLLNMTGHEKIMQYIALSSNAVGVFLLVFLTPRVGLLSTAVSLLFIFLSQSIFSFVFVCIKIKINPLPFPFSFGITNKLRRNLFCKTK